MTSCNLKTHINITCTKLEIILLLLVHINNNISYVLCIYYLFFCQIPMPGISINSSNYNYASSTFSYSVPALRLFFTRHNFTINLSRTSSFRVFCQTTQSKVNTTSMINMPVVYIHNFIYMLCVLLHIYQQ
jgi:hypothetical protein